MIPFGQAARLLADSVEKEIRRKEWLRKQRRNSQKLRLSQALQNQQNSASGVGPSIPNYQSVYPEEYQQSGQGPYFSGVQQNVIPQVLPQQQVQQQNALPYIQKTQYQQQQLQQQQQQHQQRNEAVIPLWDFGSPSQQNVVAGQNNGNTATQNQQGNAVPQVQQPAQNALGQNQQPAAPQQQQTQPNMAQASQASRYPLMPAGFFFKQRGLQKSNTVKLNAYSGKSAVLNAIDRSNEQEESSGSGHISGDEDELGSATGLHDKNLLDE